MLFNEASIKKRQFKFVKIDLKYFIILIKTKKFLINLIFIYKIIKILFYYFNELFKIYNNKNSKQVF